MASSLSPLSRSSPLLPSLSSASRPRFPLKPASCSTETADAGSCGGGGEPQEVSVASLEVMGSQCALFSRFESLRRPYRPFPVIGWNRHVETIFAAFFRSLPGVALRRECFRTSDDGSVALDWVSGDDRWLPPDSPVLILLPGLTGGSQDTYVRHMLVRARKRNWRVVVFNSRGCAYSPVTTPKLHSRKISVKWLNTYQHDTPSVACMLLAGLLEQTFLCAIWVRSHMVVHFLEQYLYVILSICQLRTRTSAGALTRYMTMLLLELYEKFSRIMHFCLRASRMNIISLWQLMPRPLGNLMKG